jgi:hypothetical protein
LELYEDQKFTEGSLPHYSKYLGYFYGPVGLISENNKTYNFAGKQFLRTIALDFVY